MMRDARLRFFGGRGDRAIGWARAAGCAVKGDAADEAVLRVAVNPDRLATSPDKPFVTCVRG
jgi:hypothetical protein